MYETPDRNVLDWCYGKYEGMTTFELLLNQTDKALDFRLFANSGDYLGGYDHGLYQSAQILSTECFRIIAGDDPDVMDYLEFAWCDSNSDIRYILENYFQGLQLGAVSLAEEEIIESVDMDEMDHWISEGNLNDSDDDGPLTCGTTELFKENTNG